MTDPNSANGHQAEHPIPADENGTPWTPRAYTLGILAVLVGSLCASSAGILVRLVDSADGWQLLFYRSAAFSITVFLFMLGQHRGPVLARFASINRLGIVVAICLGSAFIAFVFALLLTNVANAVLILSAAPFFSALLARWFIGETVTTLAWVCMIAALIGVAVMMADGLLAGTLLGSGIALIAVLGYSASVVAFRAGRLTDMMPATCLAGVFACLVSACLVSDFLLSSNDLIIAILLGTVQIGFQYVLITLAARVVPAAEIALLMLLEVVCAPLWVWVGIGEQPSALTLSGGGIVLTALVVQAARGLMHNTSQTQ